MPRLKRELRRLLEHRCLPAETLVYQCNICSGRSALAASQLQREGAVCQSCGANMRFRAVVHHLALELFGRPLPIAEFPPGAQAITGLGMSDEHVYAERLARRMGYTNTFLHREPRLDVCSPPEEKAATYDFVLSSDVLEHVAPPVERAFSGLRRLLKPGGLLVLTVPFVREGETVEHFPELHDYAIEEHEGARRLVNRTADGRRQEFTRIVFHGGPGSTLEMRLFSESGLRRGLEEAGFNRISLHAEPCFRFGIYWNQPWSVPVTARAA